MVQRIAKIGIVACMVMLMSALLAGCFGSGTAANDPNKQYRTYMSQVNQIMVEFDESLESFTDAVSRSDVVGMGNELDRALKTLDKLDGLDVPASMNDIHESYLAATEMLEAALGDYFELYTEIDAAAQDDAPVDMSAYSARIAEIQAAYDEGVQALQEADAAAAKVSTN